MVLAKGGKVDFRLALPMDDIQEMYDMITGNQEVNALSMQATGYDLSKLKKDDNGQLTERSAAIFVARVFGAGLEAGTAAENLAFNMKPDQQHMTSLEKKYGVTQEQARYLAILNDSGFEAFSSMVAGVGTEMACIPSTIEEAEQQYRDEFLAKIRQEIVSYNESEGSILGRDYTEQDLYAEVQENMKNPVNQAQLQEGIRIARAIFTGTFVSDPFGDDPDTKDNGSFNLH